MANPKQSISENMFFESAFTVKFGLTAPERLTLHNLAQEFQVVLTRLHTQSRALYAAAKGRRFTADEQRQLSDVAIAFDVGVNDLGARLLANVRPAAARRIQNAINGTN